MFGAMKILSKFKFLRGSSFDIFGYSSERRMERRLICGYEELLEELISGLKPGNYETAVQLAEIPEQIRGFDVVKKRHVEVAEKNRKELLERFRTVEDNISHQQPVEEVIN